MLKEKKVLMLKHKTQNKEFKDYIYDEQKNIIAIKVPVED